MVDEREIQEQSMSTEGLLLRRSMGTASSEDYVTWAVQRLCEGKDSPSLRILAGLNAQLEQEEIEQYFNKCCKELSIDAPHQLDDPRKAAGLVKRAYDHGELTPESALHTMASLFRYFEYSDPLLAVWYEIEEELSVQGTGFEGYLYPPEALSSVADAVDREWSLYAMGSQLKLPQGYRQYIECKNCGHIAKPVFKYRTGMTRFRAAVGLYWRKPSLWATCATCGSYEYRSMSDPEVRETYFRQLVDGQSIGANGPS